MASDGVDSEWREEMNFKICPIYCGRPFLACQIKLNCGGGRSYPPYFLRIFSKLQRLGGSIKFCWQKSAGRGIGIRKGPIGVFLVWGDLQPLASKIKHTYYRPLFQRESQPTYFTWPKCLKKEKQYILPLLPNTLFNVVSTGQNESDLRTSLIFLNSHSSRMLGRNNKGMFKCPGKLSNNLNRLWSTNV